jgi:hypothetical protein
LNFFIKILIGLICFGWSNSITAQEPQVIKVKREQDLSKAFFDNTELKLFVIDRFGNPKENKIVSFKLWIKGKDGRAISGYNNKLNAEMISELNSQKKATKIFFTDINVEDDNGHFVKLPDLIEVWFPNCKNCEVKRR